MVMVRKKNSMQISLILSKEEAAEKSLIKEFPEEDIQIINGRYGPYIKHAGNNYKIPKGKAAKAASALTLEDCKNLIENSEATNKKPSQRKVSRAKK